MSGFVAVVSPQPDAAPHSSRQPKRELLERLTDVLRSRGPDRQEVWSDGQAGLGHTLFRTTDEAEFDRQPSSLAGEVWITSNARIDGRTELVADLGLSGQIDLEQTPDSDLILHAYRVWGEKCVEHLLGDFAFAIWDKRLRRLFCARDRFGMNHLYWAQPAKGADRSLLVSNSLECMLAHPGVSKKLDEQAIADFLLFGDLTWTDETRTAFADVRTLPPAHSLTLSDGHFEIRRYWDFPLEVPLFRYRSEDEVLERFHEVFETAVADRLRGHNPVIAFSGGLDSTSIAATIRELEAESHIDSGLRGLCVLYDSIHPSDERRYAELASEHLHLETQYIDGGAYPLLAPPVPTSRPLEVYQPALWFEFERVAATKGRVMLTGEAGDNLLAYTPVGKSKGGPGAADTLAQLIRLRVRYGVTPGLGTGLVAQLRALGKGRGEDTAAPYPYPSWLHPELEKKLDLKGRWDHWWSTKPSPLNTRHPELHAALVEPDWSVEDTYISHDFTLPEKRDPFLDLRLVEFVLSLPPTPWLFKKHLLRQAMRGKVPQEVIERPKALLGMIHQTLLDLPDTGWIDQWQPDSALDRFVSHTKIPPLAGGAIAAHDSYVHLRPLMLNSWLESLR